MEFPCGKCLDCRNRRASGWSFRLRKELQDSDSAFFITLTYNTDNVPLTKNGYMSLNKRHLQLFFKRLRWSQGDNRIKYYLAGEYGSKTMRPHYHAIIFNLDLKTLETGLAKLCLAYPEIYLKGDFLFNSPLWPYGQITIGTVTLASIGYTLKYISKPSQIPKHRNDDRLREFSLMSKGLGKRYIQKNKHWHHDSLVERFYLPIEEGKKIAIPRYYKEKIYTGEQRELIGIQLIDYQEKEYEKLSDDDKLQKYDRRVLEIQEKERRLNRQNSLDKNVL